MALAHTREKRHFAYSKTVRSNNNKDEAFINKIIQFLTKNGRIEKRMLFEEPFTDQHQDGIIGIFDDAQATRIISIVDEVNRNGEVG